MGRQLYRWCEYMRRGKGLFDAFYYSQYYVLNYDLQGATIGRQGRQTYPL